MRSGTQAETVNAATLTAEVLGVGGEEVVHAVVLALVGCQLLNDLAVHLQNSDVLLFQMFIIFDF